MTNGEVPLTVATMERGLAVAYVGADLNDGLKSCAGSHAAASVLWSSGTYRAAGSVSLERGLGEP